jgi:hypothetical protein
VLKSWKELGAYVYFEKLLERAKEIEAFLQYCLQETGGSRLRDAYEERERLHPGIPSEDSRFYTHCQVCHEPIAEREAAWCVGQYHVGVCYDTLFQRCYGCGKRRMDVLTNARNWKRPDPLCNDCYCLKYGIGYSMQTWLKRKKNETIKETSSVSNAKGASKNDE